MKEAQIKYSIMHGTGMGNVEVNNQIVGHLLVGDDGFWQFWPSLSQHGGYWPTWMMREIADKVDELNTPWQKTIDEELPKLAAQHQGVSVEFGV